MDEQIILEHSRLVRLCTHLTGDRHIAEDLAQETLLEAWRNADKLRDPDKRPQWLAGIARRLCLNWARTHYRGLPHLVQVAETDAADDLDLELELERNELAQLLDRALGLLPAETRQVLVERYVRESPHAEIAERMGLSEDAVSMRLTRGKLLLRRAIITGLRDEAEAYGLYNPASDSWRETQIWCPKCGQRKLVARTPQPPEDLTFRCPACHPAPDMAGWQYRLANAHFARLIGHLTSPRSILNRATTWAHEYYMSALEARVVECTNCGRPTRLHMQLPEDGPVRTQNARGLHSACEACGEYVSSSVRALAASLPEVQGFRREHSRTRMLPEREVETRGQAAVVTGFESVTGASRLDVLYLRDTLQVVGIYGDAPLGRDR